MTQEILLYLTATSALIVALISGVFMTFSDFVMKSLVATPTVVGMEAMQMINRQVYRSLFLVLLLGMAPVAVAMAVFAPADLAPNATFWLRLGAGIYAFGVFGVTMLGNVPMNKKLDQAVLAQPEYWLVYGRGWTRWNHLRTFAAAVSALCFLLASLQFVAS